MKRPKKYPDPKPSQPSSVACVVQMDWGPSTWHYYDSGYHSVSYWSRSFKSKELAISGAVAAGYMRVRVNGKIVVDRRPKDTSPIVVDASTKTFDEESDRAGVRALTDVELVSLYTIRFSMHSSAIVDEIEKEIVRRSLSVDE